MNIKSILKGDNDLYIDLSTHVAREMQNKVVNAMNQRPGLMSDSSFWNRMPNLIDDFSSLRWDYVFNTMDPDLYKIMEKMAISIGDIRSSKRDIFKKAWEFIELIGSLDMSEEFHSHYMNNKNVLETLCSQSFVSRTSYNFPKIPQLSFIIISSEIRNTDGDNGLLANTNPFYRKYVRFIGLNLNVEVFEKQTLTIHVKYIGCDGKLSNSNNSPQGYTLSNTKNIDIQTADISLSGWGNSEKCIYDTGKHSIEVYVNDFMIYKTEFNIDLAPSEKLEQELKKEEDKLKEIRNTIYYSSEIDAANLEMNEIQKFDLFRSSSEKQRQIYEQNRKIYNINRKSENERKNQITNQQILINKLKMDIQNAEY